MATIQKIESIELHNNADALEIATVLGFKCIVKKGLFHVGEMIVFLLPDHCLPNDEEWAKAYIKFAPKRIRAIKLRGIYSEGLIVKFEEVKHVIGEQEEKELKENTDVSKQLKIEKYSAPDLHYGKEYPLAKSFSLPYDLEKTDEERWQRIAKNLPFGETIVATLKIDGQSCSYGYKLDKDDFFVTSRSVSLKTEEKNVYTDHISRYNIKEKLINYCKKHNKSFVFRGESYGPGIQNLKYNPHSQQKKHGWAMFSVYDLDQHEYCLLGSPHFFVNVAKELDLPCVPIIENEVHLTQDLINKYCEELEQLPGNNDMFEGLVITHKKGSFKVINKYYDSKK